MNEVQGIVNAVTKSYNDGMITEQEALATIVSAVAQIWDALRYDNIPTHEEVAAQQRDMRYDYFRK